MALLLEGLDGILSEGQKEMLFHIARQWVEGDQITQEDIRFVEFGERADIQNKEWNKLKQEMLENFKTKEEDLRRFEQNDEKMIEDSD